MSKNRIIAGLDIGSGTIKALAVKESKTEENIEVLALAEKAAFGVRKGIVIDPAEVSNIIQKVLAQIKEQIGQEINSVYVNVGGSHIFSTTSRGLVSVSRADQKISQEDIERVLQAAQTFSLPLNREILEVFSKEFIIDGQGGIKEAQGFKGVRLEAEVLVLGGFSPYLKNLNTAVLNSGLQINDLILSPLASSRAVLTTREKELGVVLLDIGLGTTSFAVFEEGDLIHLAILPIGSGHITNDIAIFLKSDIEAAERIKLEFGTLFFQGKDKREKIKIDQEETLIFSQKQLSLVIEARVAEIFREVNKELKKIEKKQLLPSGVVLTGGGANLPKIKELAKKEFHLPCRIGKPKGFSLIEDDPRFSVVCGLVLSGTDFEKQETDLEDGIFPGFWKKIGGKIKKIFRIFIP